LPGDWKRFAIAVIALTSETSDVAFARPVSNEERVRSTGAIQAAQIDPRMRRRAKSGLRAKSGRRCGRWDR
jgi:hypothetical protein